MKKLLILIIYVLLLQCDNSKKKVHVNYTQLLSDCLSMNDAKVLEEGIEIFETLLLDQYKLDEKADMSIYERFASDIGSFKFSRDFFVNDKTIKYLKSIEKTPTFAKIFIRLEDYFKEEENFKQEIDTTEAVDTIQSIELDEEDIIVTPRLEEIDPVEELGNYYKLRTRGPFLQCLIQQSENEDLKEYLNTLILYSDISPGILGGAISEVASKLTSNKDRELLKLSMVYLFYYEAVLVINQF